MSYDRICSERKTCNYKDKDKCTHRYKHTLNIECLFKKCGRQHSFVRRTCEEFKMDANGDHLIEELLRIENRI